ncbi:MAG: phosphopantetheine-binding protein [Clostridiales bacterium]|jgi:acyl carrier protein|nr:phosphopantetheine-binding protein [Clostridiales bacterium]
MDIIKELSDIIREYKGEDVVLSADTDFDELGFDSLDRIELIMAAEEKFNITFENDLNVTTVAELIQKIEELTA